jgi:hypothetical protein
MHRYGSATAVYDAAQDSIADTRRKLTVLYVGDWDPSGLAMSAVDLPERIWRYGGEVNLQRLAITASDQQADLPSFSAFDKRKDPRYHWFTQNYGVRCWELDAMNPVDLRERVAAAIHDVIDVAAWERADVVERAERESLTSILNSWPGISRQASE